MTDGKINVDGNDAWTASRLVVVAVATLAVAFTIISLIAETGLGRY
ncbi:MAG: hypothetical protein HY904_17710 [Deltaproteobacteria bacterium]|nr:hypothetical protein [Deltaproteobacteria bacterium]